MKTFRRVQSLQRIVLAAAIGGLLLAPALFGADSPYTRPDGTWITLSGEVTTVSPDTFLLDYGDGAITVEMDDGDRDADAYKLIEGDRVTVSGLIDDDFYEARTIEASSVFVEKLGTHFYASAVDEEDRMLSIATPVVISAYNVSGTITEVRDDAFVLDTGLQTLTVDVSDMAYDPLDDEGYQRLDVGDWVSVSGSVNSGLFERRTLEADVVSTVYDM